MDPLPPAQRAASPHSAPARRHYRVATAVLAGLLAGCTVLPSSGPGNTSHSHHAAATLSSANDALFANRYTAAEGLYRQYTEQRPADALGHAWFALFLNYQQRYSEAKDEVGIAVRLAPHDAFAFAVDTRVTDWSAQGQANLRTAVGLGERAVKLGPKDVLAHVFLSEALADSGSTTRSSQELDDATALGPAEGFEKAEIERERANLAHDTGDKSAQLMHLKQAQALQPNWVERTRELAEYYFGADRLDLATDAFRKATAMDPSDAILRTTLGDVALLRQDVTLADDAYNAAHKLRPHETEIDIRLAVTTFAVHRDAAATEAVLRQALRDTPNNEQVGELLQGFLRYIKRDQSAASAIFVGSQSIEDSIAFRHSPPLTIDDQRTTRREAALATINTYRAKAHLTPVQLDDRIDEGATSHAYWWFFNIALPQVKDLGIHHEVSGTPGFTGVTMRERATSFGYPSASMSEDITHAGGPGAAIQEWIDSVYHRFPILRPDLNAVGFGDASAGPLPIEVLDMAYSSARGDPRATYPYPADGEAGVPTSFLGNELPDPVPPGAAYPTGYPITVNFYPYARVLVSAYALTAPSGAQIPLYVLQPSPSGTENAFSMLPRSPLQNSATYHVHVGGTIDGAGFAIDWSFTTEAAQQAATHG